MASDVDICNRALTKLGEARITSLTDNLEPARVLNSLFEIVRDAELRSRVWRFAISRASLAALVATPDWGFDYQYQMPSDCLRILQVGEYYPGVSLTDYRNTDEAEWRIEGRKILTNLEAPLKIRYVASISDTGQWDAAFVEAFACRLAVESAEALTQSTSKRELAWEEYKQAIKMAVRANAIESAPEPLPDSEWVVARL